VSPEIELSVVMPCLNEAETLATCITKAQACIRTLGIRGEIVVADNGSTDGCPEIAARLGARVVRVSAPGYGNALLGGIRAAHGRFIVVGDADDSYDFTALGPFVDKLRQGYDLVMGNRFRGGIRPGAMPALHRYLGNPVLTGIGRLLFRSASRDFHCGLRAFRRDAAMRMGLRTTGMEFASEMVVKATLLGMKVAEVPATLSQDGRTRPPHLRSWRDGWRHLRFLLLYCPRWLFLYPGALIVVLGLAAGAWLLPGPRIVGSVRFDVSTLLYSAAAVLLGFQAITFAVFSNLYASGEGLRPADPSLNRLLPFTNLEAGLLVGAGLVVAGLGGSILALMEWNRASFGDLDPSRTLRTVIPAATALTLGVQVSLSSFLLAILTLGRR
jgi:glycosyltransferase involved in cell wall biosynthesis